LEGARPGSASGCFKKATETPIAMLDIPFARQLLDSRSILVLNGHFIMFSTDIFLCFERSIKSLPAFSNSDFKNQNFWTFLFENWKLSFLFVWTLNEAISINHALGYLN
jgi:hypothetical protein